MQLNRSNIKNVQVLIGPLSAIQPFSHPLTFNFPWSLGFIRKLAFGSPWGNYFTTGFVCIQHTAPKNIKLPSKYRSDYINIVRTKYRTDYISIVRTVQISLSSLPYIYRIDYINIVPTVDISFRLYKYRPYRPMIVQTVLISPTPFQYLSNCVYMSVSSLYRSIHRHIAKIPFQRICIEHFPRNDIFSF